MTAKRLKIDQLKLDQHNPRIGDLPDQHAAMQAIIDDQGMKLANLAESIVSNGGLNPMDNFLVMSDPDDSKFIVLEGNRRALALKLLVNPAALTGLRVPSAMQKRFEALAPLFEKKSVEPVSAWIVPDRTSGATWIEMRHIGEDDGRGIVRWGNEAKTRWTGGNPALQAINFVRRHGGLDEEELKALEKIPLTNLDRLLSTPAVRAMIGFDVKENTLLTALPAEEAIKPLRRIALDLTVGRNGKKVVVTELKKVPQQTAYIRTLDVADMPDLSKVGGSPKPLAEVDVSGVGPRKRAKGARKPVVRETLVQRGSKLNVNVGKMQEIYEELSGLKLSKYRNAIAVLLRVFMELSTDHYVTGTMKGLLKTQMTNGKPRFKRLDEKLKEAMEHMIKAGADKADFVDIQRAMSQTHHPLSIDIQHAYVHGRYMTPREGDLTAAWDNAQPFLEKIWP